MRENKNNPGGSQSGKDRSGQNLSQQQQQQRGNVGRDLNDENQNPGQGQQQFRGTSGMQGGQGGAHGRNPGQQNTDEPVMSDEDEIGGVDRPDRDRNNQSQQQQRRGINDQQ